MAGETMMLDPEVERILREVAADPRSMLLRVPRSKAVATVYEDSPAAGGQTAGLSSAEREIVNVYRGEVAWLLRQVCLYKLLEGPKSKKHFCRYISPENVVTVLTPIEWSARVQTMPETASGEAEWNLGLALLLRCVADPLGEEPRVSEIAAAAHRLQPWNETRIYSAMDFMRDRSPLTALRLLHRVLERSPTGPEMGSAWDVIAFCHNKLGDLGSAHEALVRGSSSCPGSLRNLMNRLIAALQVSMRDSALDASARLDEMVGEDHPAVTWFVDSARELMLAGEWAPTEDGKRLGVALAPHLNGAGRRIANVLS